jgi:DNA-binding winged helix-turn-helix (wHTH) protein/Tol biopolymer transport system component
MIDQANTVFCFDGFELDTERRILFRGEDVVPLKAKAFDLLLTLVQSRGEVISKNELLDRVWENQFVEENNLTVHIAALRKALGERKNENRYIVTVPGKGYRFVGETARPTNGEVRIESRKFQKIVVREEEVAEESIDDLEHDSPVDVKVASARRLRTRVRGKRVAIFGALAITIFGIAAASAWRSRMGGNMFSANVPFRNHHIAQLTTNGKVGNAALSPDGKLFAYVIDDLGSKSLWLGKVTGGNHLQLRPAAEATYHTLAFSSDSSQLYFSIQDAKNPNSALYAIPVLGGVSTKIKDGISHFAMSPDGKQLARGRRDSDNDVLTISSIDGSNIQEVASFPKKESFLFDSISWSADGGRLAVSTVRPGHMDRQELSVIEIASGTVSRIPLPIYRQVTKTSWLKNGSGLVVTAIEEASHSSVPQYRLVHVSYPDGTATEITTDRSNYGESWHNDAGATLSIDEASRAILTVEHRQLSNVWIAAADDLSSARQITFSSFGRYDGLWGLDWTPDGRIVYTTSDTRNQYLATMNADGTDQKPLTDPVRDRGHVDSVLTVSGDGRYIFFHSDRISGEFDIWRADIDGSNPKQLTLGGKAFHPAPSPDGQWVYYKSFLNGTGSLCRVPVDGGDPECFTDKETSWMSFSPDGKFIAASYITDRRRLAIISAETHEILKQFELPKTGTLFMGSRWTADGKSVTYRDTAYGYWVQDIEGGAPRRLDGLPKEKFYNFSWSRDGKWLAFVRGQEIRDVVLFQGEE